MTNIRDRLWEKAGPNKIPLTVAFELTPTCNLSCKMCYVRKSMQEVNNCGGLIRAKEWIAYAKEAADLGMLFPLLTGGEPLLHPDFKEIFIAMQNIGMQISINSNATMIDKEMAKWFSEHTPTRINITLYGASPETYEKLCGDKAAFYKVQEAIKWLKFYKIPIKFNASITSYNLDDLDKIISFAKSIDVPIQVATYMFPPIRRNKEMIGKNDRLNAKAAGYAKVKADYLYQEPEWFKGQVMRFSNFVNPKDIDFDKLEKSERKMKCRAGYCSFWIDWQGNMLNCGMHSPVKYNLKQYTIKEAWLKLYEDTKSILYSSICSNCPNMKLCHTCIAMINNECGSSGERPKYICEMNYAASLYYQEFADKYYKDVKIESTEINISKSDCEVDKY